MCTDMGRYAESRGGKGGSNTEGDRGMDGTAAATMGIKGNGWDG